MDSNNLVAVSLNTLPSSSGDVQVQVKFDVKNNNNNNNLNPFDVPTRSRNNTQNNNNTTGTGNYTDELHILDSQIETRPASNSTFRSFWHAPSNDPLKANPTDEYDPSYAKNNPIKILIKRNQTVVTKFDESNNNNNNNNNNIEPPVDNPEQNNKDDEKNNSDDKNENNNNNENESKEAEAESLADPNEEDEMNPNINSLKVLNISKWLPDHLAPKCMKNNPLCTQRFHLFARRHHCRSCGSVFCDSHAPKRFNEKFNGKVRLCDNCYFISSNPVNEEKKEDDSNVFTISPKENLSKENVFTWYGPTLIPSDSLLLLLLSYNNTQSKNNDDSNNNKTNLSNLLASKPLLLSRSALALSLKLINDYDGSYDKLLNLEEQINNKLKNQTETETEASLFDYSTIISLRAKILSNLFLKKELEIRQITNNNQVIPANSSDSNSNSNDKADNKDIKQDENESNPSNEVKVDDSKSDKKKDLEKTSFYVPAWPIGYYTRHVNSGRVYYFSLLADSVWYFDHIKLYQHALYQQAKYLCYNNSNESEINKLIERGEELNKELQVLITRFIQPFLSSFNNFHHFTFDSQVESCSSTSPSGSGEGPCKKTFTLTTRRHHCRECGKIFCHDHSLKRSSTFNLRLCDQCENILSLRKVELESVYPKHF